MTIASLPARRFAVRGVLLLVLALAIALVTLPMLRGEAAGEELKLVASNWSGGGGRLTGGNVAIESSIGQPNAGVLGSGPLVLEGGFQHSQLALDVNCDDSVNALDPVFLLLFLAGSQAQGPCSLDANRDATVSILDPLLIRRRIAGLP